MISADALVELVGDAERARTQGETALREAEARVSDLRTALDVLRDEERVLRAMLARRSPTVPKAVTVVSTDAADDALESWASLGRSDAVFRAVAFICQKAESASPKAIEKLLAQHGRSDNRDEIGGATAYLNNKARKIHSLGRGQWVLGPDPRFNNSGSAPSEAEPTDANPGLQFDDAAGEGAAHPVR